MGNVYRVGSIGETVYFNTAREADGHRPGGEEPESVIRVDAAGECNRLERYLETTERTVARARYLLEALRDLCPVDVIHRTDTGREVNRFLKENPTPPATSSDRDGGRSYGI